MAIRTLREGAFQVEAPRLFNSLPRTLREFKGFLLALKGGLDKLLETIDDKPRGYGADEIPEATNIEGAPSNSIRDWLRRRSDDGFDYDFDSIELACEERVMGEEGARRVTCGEEVATGRTRCGGGGAERGEKGGRSKGARR